MNSTEEEHCDECCFSAWDDAENMLVCRHNAPIPTADPHKNAEWPMIKRNDWCGQWKKESFPLMFRRVGGLPRDGSPFTQIPWNE